MLSTYGVVTWIRNEKGKLGTVGGDLLPFSHNVEDVQVWR